MNRKEALNIIMKTISNKDAIISSTGLISREIFEYYDSEQIFYMPGSMGLASSIGLGIAINKPNKKIFVIDGDSSLLMNLGTMATIGYISPKNLIHIVLDNGAYASCSEEPSISNTARLDKIAKVVGYYYVCNIKNKQKLVEAIKKCSITNESSFILVNIKLGGRRDLARPLNLIKIKYRFKTFLFK